MVGHSPGDPVTHKLTFKGYIDGIAITYGKGNVSFNIVMKPDDVALTETNLGVPGISPTGLSPFTSYAIYGEQTQAPDIVRNKIEAVVSGENIIKGFPKL